MEKDEPNDCKAGDYANHIYVQWVNMEVMLMEAYLFGMIMFLLYYWIRQHFFRKSMASDGRDIAKELEDFLAYRKPQIDWSSMTWTVVLFPLFTIV